MKTKIALAAFLPLAALWVVLAPALVVEPGCATVSAISRAVTSCASEQGGKIAYDLEQASVQLVTDILACDPTLDASLLPTCVENGLTQLARDIGPDGERFVECVVTRVENDPRALAYQRLHAKSARTMLFRKAGWSRSK